MLHLSIITINFNNADGLRKTIESVINQTFTNFEYIVIDGASTDGSVEIINEYADKISYFISEQDRGIYDAMNKGIERAKGKYIQFLNSGDWFVNPTILQKLFSVEHTADILYGDANFVVENKIIGVFVVGKEEEITLAYLLKHGLCHQASFISNHLFLSGLYDDNLKIVSDWKFFIERIIFDNCSIKKINLVIINFDKSGISCKAEYLNLQKAEREKVITQLIPERIEKDYKKLILISDSPLLKYMPFLNNTNRFHKLISKIVGLLIKMYSFFRVIIRGTQYKLKELHN